MNKNIYGFVSGGYLFDKMDRAALKKVRRNCRGRYWFTESAKIKYKKQCCNKNDLLFMVYRPIEISYGVVSVRVVAASKNSKIYCVAEFVFVKKSYSYCDLHKNKGLFSKTLHFFGEVFGKISHFLQRIH